MPRGSKGKYTPEIVVEICKYVRAGNNYRDSAILAGIAESTFYGWQQQYESDGITPNPEFHLDFLDALKKAEGECKARNIALIQKHADKSWQAAAWYLERKYNNEYALKQIQEIGGIMDENGKRQEIGLYINLGQGFVPSNITLPSSSSGSVDEKSAKIQSPHLASQGKKNVHRNKRVDKTSTS